MSTSRSTSQKVGASAASAIPMPATATPAGSSHIAPRRSDQSPNSGWISDEDAWDARITAPTAVYESEKRSFRKGSSAGSAPFEKSVAQCRAPIGLEAGDVRTRRGDAERERLPPVLEGGVLDVHRDGAVDDVADSGRAKEVGQVAGPAAGADRPSLDLGIERLGRIPERTDRAAVGEVPHACGDDAAVPRHPRHLAEACDRIVHDVDHELGERRIEAASFERQILSRRAGDLDSGMAAA